MENCVDRASEKQSPRSSIFARTIEFPKLSDWRCHLFGSDGLGITWQPQEGNVPNRFWRWMQFICFGNRWERIPGSDLPRIDTSERPF